MIKKIVLTVLIAFFINTSQSPAQINEAIEIYDINQGMVLKTITNSPYIRKDSELILQGINDIYKKFNPIPEKGLLVKVPLDPALHVTNQWVNTLVDELIVFYPEDEEPFILVYDDENNIYFFTIKRDVTTNILLTLFHTQL